MSDWAGFWIAIAMVVCTNNALDAMYGTPSKFWNSIGFEAITGEKKCQDVKKQ